MGLTKPIHMLHKYNFRIVFILFFVLVHSSAFSKAYYVATDGDDSWPGTINMPWATWDKAFSTAINPGDTTYFRGGVYYVTSKVSLGGVSGTESKPICFFIKYSINGSFVLKNAPANELPGPNPQKNLLLSAIK